MVESCELTNRKISLRETRGFLTQVPFNQLLGIELHRTHADGVTMRCKVRDELRNNAAVLHGGVAATLADVSAAVAIYRHFADRRRITTVELKINYFRPVSEGTLFARAHLLRVGSTICVGRVDLTDDQKRAVGAAMVTYIFLDAGKRG
jgi:uncharacterized protein (TIGR00369 family)